MLEKEKHYIIEITDISSDGNGVGQIDGIVVFVPRTAVGDRAEISITKLRKRYALAKLIRLVQKSADRVDPACPVFHVCGGCQLQHIGYDAQLKAKKGFIEAAFRRIGGFSGFTCDDMLSMTAPFRYRNKCIFQIGIDGKGEFVSGFYRNRSHDIIPVEDCLNGSEINGGICGAVIAYMKENDISPYDERQHQGVVRRIFIRTAETTGEIMVVVSVNADGLPSPERLIKRLRKVSENIASVYVNINRERHNNLLGGINKLIYGKAEIMDTLCGIVFRISPDSFYQVNPSMTERLYYRALEYADISEEDSVMDIYCGIGTISLAAARNAKHVIGIELVEQAIVNARENAVENGIENVEFYAETAETAVPRLIRSGIKPDIAILDPPRKGSDEATLSAIVCAEPKRIVYISCNPATLARDARYLADQGYLPVKCTGADMFGNTCHVECVVLMSRVEGK